MREQPNPENRDGLVFLSGATGAVGSAVTEALVAAGTRVVSFQRTVCRLEGVESVICDFADDASDIAIADALTKFGTPDGVVVNSGIAQNGPVAFSPTEAFRAVMNVNAIGSYRFIQPIVRKMMLRRLGSIVFVSSSSALTGSAGQANYSASKAALIGLARSLSLEVGPYNIRSNVLLAGLLDGGLSVAMGAPARAEVLSRTALRRAGALEEIADAVAWLLSDKSTYVTGACIPVDGGLSMGGT